VKKTSEMSIVDVINAVNTIESNTTYITLSFNEKVKIITNITK
jgi:hypothetical protein